MKEKEVERVMSKEASHLCEKQVLEMLEARLTCMKLDDLSCIEEGCSHNCDDCEFNYAQGTRGEQKEALNIAIQSIKKLQEYQEIGTVKYFTKLKELRMPIKSVWPMELFGFKLNAVSLCPNCLSFVYKYCKFCRACGQALDWSQED